MTNHDDMLKKVRDMLKQIDMSAYDVAKITRELCNCCHCKHFVQHYAKDGSAVDFGHCAVHNIIKPKRPHDNACGLWSDEEVRE